MLQEEFKANLELRNDEVTYIGFVEFAVKLYKRFEELKKYGKTKVDQVEEIINTSRDPEYKEDTRRLIESFREVYNMTYRMTTLTSVSLTRMGDDQMKAFPQIAKKIAKDINNPLKSIRNFYNEIDCIETGAYILVNTDILKSITDIMGKTPSLMDLGKEEVLKAILCPPDLDERVVMVSDKCRDLKTTTEKLILINGDPKFNKKLEHISKSYRLLDEGFRVISTYGTIGDEEADLLDYTMNELDHQQERFTKFINTYGELDTGTSN